MCTSVNDDDCPVLYAGDSPMALPVSIAVEGAPVDLTGKSVILVFKSDAADSDGEALRTITTGALNGGGATSGQATVTFSTDDVSALPPDLYFVKVKTTDNGNPATVVTYGVWPVRVSP